MPGTSYSLENAEMGGAVSTRKLIIAALVCGLVILVAFTVQLLLAF